MRVESSGKTVRHCLGGSSLANQGSKTRGAMGMHKKFLFTSLTAVLAVAAFAVMPAMASAATREYGTCAKAAPETKPPCGAKYKFTPFAEGTAIPVLTKNVTGTGEFIFQFESTPANGDRKS